MFLSKAELHDMTEVSKRPLQEAWLKRYRIPYTKGHHGKLNVLRAYVERTHGLTNIEVQTSAQTEPDVNVFRRQASG